MNTTEVKLGSPGSTAPPETATVGLAKEALKGLEDMLGSEQPKEGGETIQGRRKQREEGQTQKPKTEGGEKPTAEAKTPIQEEFDTKLDEAAEQQLGQGKKFTDATTISNKVAILREALEAQVKTEGKTDEQNKVLLEHFSKLEKLCEHQEQKIFQKTEWEQAQAELKNLRKEQLGEAQQLLLERAHQEIFADTIENPQHYGITSQTQAREAAQTLVHAKLSQYEQEHATRPADQVPEVSEPSRMIVEEKLNQEFERPIGEQLQESIDELVTPEGLAVKAHLEELRKLLQEPPTPDQWKKIQAVYKEMPDEYHFKNDPTLNRAKLAIYHHLSQEQNIQDYGLRSLLTEEELKTWESNPQAQVDLIRDKLADQVHEFYFGRRKGHAPPTSVDYRWNSSAERLPTNPKDKDFVECQRLKTILDEFNTKANPASSFGLKGAALDRIIAETYDRITEGGFDEQLLIDKIPNFMNRLAERYIILSEAGRNEQKGWNSLVVNHRIQVRYWLNSSLQVRRTQDRLTRETRLLDNVLKQSAQHQRQNHIGFLESEDFCTEGKLYFEEPANWPEIEKANGLKPGDITCKQDLLDKKVKTYHEIIDPELYEEFRKQLVDKLTAGDMLLSNATSWELGKQEQMDVGLAGYAEPGLQQTLNDRGFNHITLEVLDGHGEYISWSDFDGQEISVSGPILQKLKNDTVNELWTLHRDELERLFKKEYGGGATLTRLDVEGSVNEVYMWATITGRRAEWNMRGRTPQASAGRDPSQYASELGGDGIVKQAQRPFTNMEFRWSTASDVSERFIEEVAAFDSIRMNIIKDVKERLTYYRERTPEYRRLVKYALDITDENNSDQVKRGMHIFQFDENGEKIARELESLSIDDVDKKMLERALLKRLGLEMSEPGVLSGYGYFAATWNRKETITVLEALFGKNKAIGLHEHTCDAVSELFNPTADHDKIHAIQSDHEDGLIHRDDANPDKEGMLVVMGRHSAGHIWEALYSTRDPLAINFYQNHYAELDIYRSQSLGEAATRLSAERPDVFLKRDALRTRMIDKRIAEAGDPMTGLDKSKFGKPIDYSRLRTLNDLDLNDPVQKIQRDALTEVCKLTGVDPNEFIRVRRILTDFALTPEVLTQVAKPINAKFFLSIHRIDPRFHMLDSIPAKYLQIELDEKGELTGRKVWTDKEMEEIGAWSWRISHSDGYGAGAGLKRWVMDQVNTWKALIPHLMPIADAKTPKEFEEHLEPLVEQVKMTGGDGAKARTTHSLTMAYLKLNQMDVVDDFVLGTDDEQCTRDITIAQRIGGKAFHAVKVNEADHILHHAEGVAGHKFHNIFPHMAHVAEERARVVVFTAKLPKPVRTFLHKAARRYNIKLLDRAAEYKLTIRSRFIYRAIGLAMLALGAFGIGGYKQVQKGLSGDDSDGGGGGGGHH